MSKHFIKKKIKDCFNRSHKTYDQYSFIQEKTCFELINSLINFSWHYTVIADFACGTGLGIKYLAKYIKYEKIYALDFSINLLSLAKEKFQHGKIEFILSDFDKSIFKKNSLNLVFCNMGLQWSLDLKNTLKLFHSYLTSSGRLAFSMPLQGTFCELNPVFRNPYYSESEIREILSQMGFVFEVIKKIIYVEKFSNQLDALRSIKAVGANCKVNGGGSRPGLNDFFVDKSVAQLTYNIGIFVVRPSSSRSGDPVNHIKDTGSPLREDDG